MNTMQGAELPWLIETYFSDSSKRLWLNKGEVLMEEGGYNDRLYLVIKGILKGFVKNPENENYELFRADKHKFVGVHSFFSKTFLSTALVVAERESEVAYIDQKLNIVKGVKGESLFEQFMPVVVSDLASRQQLAQKSGFENERALKKLIESEKMASLGQMATGMAHELNNALVVLERNTCWLGENISQMLKDEHTDVFDYFRMGLKKGRELSTREIRKRTKFLIEKFSLNDQDAGMLAETGIAEAELNTILSSNRIPVKKLYHYWQLGVTFHDMEIAAVLGSSVVTSVKALGGQKSIQKEKADINETIRKSLSLLSSPLRMINVSLSLLEIPPVNINKSEMVQVWTNLVKNAVESLNGSDIKNKKIEISSNFDNHSIFVYIQDNGPGIPREIQQEIFKPNFTTKEKGLDFGLGLGLVITQRIINSYNGEVSVKSKPGETMFKIKIPV